MRRYPRYLNEIDGKEQANAVAPNFVHSFDSAHLQLTINAAAKDGMKNFLVIHDSFSTDANNAGRFNKIIRREFVNMYKDFDHVNKFHDECEEMLDITLETPRETLGDFKIEEVLKSEYFFS
jgi:DNA-directed RNA polymerase